MYTQKKKPSEITFYNLHFVVPSAKESPLVFNVSDHDLRISITRRF